MSEDRFQRSVQRMIDGWSSFFWDAFAALAINGISGDYVEFGSLSGTTLWLAHDNMREFGAERHLWAFDSFQGLPEWSDARDEHPAFAPGHGGGGVEAFHRNLADHAVPRDAYTTVEGFYEHTLPPLGDDGPPLDIALAYIDCNLYSSTVTVMEFLEPRLKHGMILAVDDWYCWSATDISGERAAVEEFAIAHPEWRFHRFKDVHWAGLSFVVERADSGPQPPIRLG